MNDLVLLTGTGGGGGGSGTPGNPSSSIQFNSSGSFAGDASYEFVANTSVTLQQTTAATNVANQNSPTRVIGGTVWTGAASANDQWTMQDVVGAGTNGTSTLTFSHSGSSGAAAIAIPNGALGTSTLLFSGTTVGLSAVSQTLYVNGGGNSPVFNLTNAATIYSQILGTSSTTTVQSSPTGSFLLIRGNITTAITSQAVQLTNQTTFTGSSAGEQRVVAVTGTFAPTSGTTTFAGLTILPTINQTGTSSGNYTALKVNVVETALKGSANLLLDLQSGATGGTSQFAVSNTGVITVPSTNTATSATAGANGAVPAQVAGYLIVSIAGTSQKIPYFNA